MKPNSKGLLPYRGVVDCAYKILTREGVLAFWTGFGAYYFRCAPFSMIVLLSREQITDAYNHLTGLKR